MLNPLKLLLVFVSATGLVLGFVAPVAGLAHWQPAIWGGAAGLVLLSLYAEIFSSLRRGEFGLDLVAALSMSLISLLTLPAFYLAGHWFHRDKARLEKLGSG